MDRQSQERSMDENGTSSRRETSYIQSSTSTVIEPSAIAAPIETLNLTTTKTMEQDNDSDTSWTRHPSFTVKFQTTRTSIPVRAIFNYPLTVFDYAGRTWWEQMIAKN